MPVGSEVGGSFGPADGTRLMELSKYAEQARHEPQVPATPEVLADQYLRGPVTRRATLRRPQRNPPASRRRLTGC